MALDFYQEYTQRLGQNAKYSLSNNISTGIRVKIQMETIPANVRAKLGRKDNWLDIDKKIASPEGRAKMDACRDLFVRRPARINLLLELSTQCCSLNLFPASQNLSETPPLPMLVLSSLLYSGVADAYFWMT